MAILQELDYQLQVLESINDIFKGVPLNREKSNANPIFNLKDQFVREQLKENISTIQNKNSIKQSMRLSRFIEEDEDYLGIDIKMETGTGKTYVYTRLMLELNKHYGFNKFIIITPTVPIKEGTKAFINSKAFKEHYRLYPDFAEKEIKLSVLDAQKSSKRKRRLYIPRAVNEFTDGDSYAKETIFAFLTGRGMLTKGVYSTLYRNDYDANLIDGSSRPVDALANTRPIVIIDEPHKFDRANKTFQFIKEELRPQAIFRFGATFPENNDGSKDYDNLIYNLTSAEAFNKDLVKGVSIYNPEFDNPNKTKFTLLNVSNKKPKTAKFRNEKTKKESELHVGASLAELDASFGNLYLEDIGKQELIGDKIGIRLSNDKVIAVRDALLPGVFSTSYQELMINQAIELHFRKEQENFLLKSPRYKTLTLFFIDSPDSYRTEKNEDGKLRLYFQERLTIKLQSLIKEYENKKDLRLIENEYLEYLKASLKDIRATNAGYFSKDNLTTDEAVQKEVNNILRDKEILLKFKNDENKWNTCRFIFSKWTLREGWDNPNIFVIAKLRSSGSDNSKIQEVGRGLRLPVNEFGVRAIAGEDAFFLDYLVDHTENDFADKLYAEINEGILNFKNVKDILESVAQKLGQSPSKLAAKLMLEDYIDENYDIIEENRKDFYDKYPDFQRGVKKGKLTKGKPKGILIRKENFKKISELWSRINREYMVDFEDVSEELLRKGISASLTKETFNTEYSNFKKKTISSNNSQISLTTSFEGEFILYESKLKYGEFLKKLSNRTSIPISLLHEEIVNFHQTQCVEIYPTNNSINKFVSSFEEWFIKEFETRYSYRKVTDSKKKTALTHEDGTPLEKINQADIGVYKNEGAVPTQYLYEELVYDSDIEKDNIKNSNISKVEVFGKIPRRSIRIPMYFGGTTSPDFMYVVSDSEGNQTMNLILESKDMEKESSLRKIEDKKISASEKFFEVLKNEGLNVKYTRQLKHEKILDVLNNLWK